MNTINANTKIASILKQRPEALEAIISISPKFNKLRNPLLRKIMASRTSISMASKIGGCSVNDFFSKLQPLGFLIDNRVVPEESQKPGAVPGFMKSASKAAMLELDVRSVIEAGKDPFHLILEKIGQLQTGQILKLINSFEPVPLIQLLARQGFETYTETAAANLIFTYFFRPGEVKPVNTGTKQAAGDWDEMLQRFEGKIITVDVRSLEMPQPMFRILEELDKLPEDKALYVYHKRIPVFLLPELNEGKFDYRIKEISDAEVHMLICKS